ncbi:MAG: lipid-A-disaccharide synthase [Candidatus Methylopumilus sp.]|nr:lipid-A-disaccharide synthase [Candidatus Methylopumilus sp.]
MNQGFSYFLWHIVEATQNYFNMMSGQDLTWLVVGLFGQLLFMMRFIVQWIHSERHQKSLIPISFWYFSLLGSIIVLAYGIHKTELVIIVGQLPGTLVYIRNLMLLRQEQAKN